MYPNLILASTSSYRAALLSKLNIPFTAMSPNIDETPDTSESAENLVKRLAYQKAKAIAGTLKDSDVLIIGSDQVCSIDGQIVGKPGNIECAKQQLKQASGKKITFFTGLCLYNALNQQYQLIAEPFSVYFRKLTDAQIQRYIAKENPIDCAGSFKSEGLGITLFEKLEGRDPNTLVGLPLIGLTDMLLKWGYQLP